MNIFLATIKHASLKTPPEMEKTGANHVNNGIGCDHVVFSVLPFLGLIGCLVNRSGSTPLDPELCVVMSRRCISVAASISMLSTVESSRNKRGWTGLRDGESRPIRMAPCPT